VTSPPTAPPEIALHFENVHAAYGAVKALHGVTLEIPEGTVVTLLGANGAGKTTALRTASGQLAPTEGRIRYRGEDIAGKSPGQLVRRGVVHVPEGREMIADLTVEENLRVGGYTRKNRAEVKTALQSVYELFPRLQERRKQRAGALSGGEQQMLAIGRGLMSDPKLLLLDEPSLGLAPLVVQDIFQTLRTINRERGVTILLVEQNAAVALKLASHAYVLETGRIALHGPAAELRQNDGVRKSYLGY
jgi:branched-chain amino acid transport system ATP-binding protein